LLAVGTPDGAFGGETAMEVNWGLMQAVRC